MQTIFCNSNSYLNCYIEIIRQICPESILDIGMLMKRYGMLCRQVGEYEIDSKANITGIDYLADYKVGVFDHIYNQIITQKELLNGSYKQNPDLVFFLDPSLFFLIEEQKIIWQWVINHARYVVTNSKDENFVTQELRKRTLQLEDVRLTLYKI